MVLFVNVQIQKLKIQGESGEWLNGKQQIGCAQTEWKENRAKKE